MRMVNGHPRRRWSVVSTLSSHRVQFLAPVQPFLTSEFLVGILSLKLNQRNIFIFSGTLTCQTVNGAYEGPYTSSLQKAIALSCWKLLELEHFHSIISGCSVNRIRVSCCLRFLKASCKLAARGILNNLDPFKYSIPLFAEIFLLDAIAYRCRESLAKGWKLIQQSGQKEIQHPSPIYGYLVFYVT